MIPGLAKVERQEKLVKRIAILIVFCLVITVIAVTCSKESRDRKNKKLNYMRSLYENMYISDGFTLNYQIEVSFDVTDNTSMKVDTVNMRYMATEEVDQYGKKKKLHLHTEGMVMGNSIQIMQDYYYDDKTCIMDTITEDAQGNLQHKLEKLDSVANYEYNPMLSLAVLVSDQPGEFTLTANRLNGSISLADIGTFLQLCPFNDLFKGIENMDCFDKQVNELVLFSDGSRLQSLTLDLSRVAYFLVSPIYLEQGLNIKIQTYRMTVFVDSWETPKIEMPKLEETEESK